MTLLAVMVGCALRTHNLWSHEFWTDELAAIRTSHTLESVKAHCFQRFTSPPLRYAATWFFLNFPHEDRLIRIPSLITGVLVIPLIALFARNLFGPEVGLWSAWVSALNPWLIAHSQDGRMHGVAMFFYVLALWLALGQLGRNRPVQLLFAGFSLAISSAVTYAAVIVCTGALTVVLLRLFRSFHQTFLRDALCFLLPWGLWMVVWLGLVWIMTPVGENGPKILETGDRHGESPVIHAESFDHLEKVRPTVPILNPAFYREAMVNTWNDAGLKFLSLIGAGFFLFSGGSSGLSRTSRSLLFLIPILLILLLQPEEIYRRYLLSLLPLLLIGIALFLDKIGRRLPGVVAAVGLFLAVAIPPTAWVLTHSPQPWNSVKLYLQKEMDPTDQLLVGTHQSEFAASYYLVGKIPSWTIIYHGLFQNRFRETPPLPGNCWLVQWYGIPPDLEKKLLEIYERAAEFEGRYGTIVLYREKGITADDPSQES